MSNTAARPTIAGTRPISPWRDIRDGLSYVWNQPHLRAAMYLAFLVNLTAFPLTGTLLAYVAKNIYGIGQTGLGWLAASFAFGALVGSIALSTHGANIRPARIMLAASAAWYALLIVFAFMTSPVAGCVLLMAAGFAQSLCMVPMAVMLLRATQPAFRGRVMGVRMLAVYGMPLGILAAGPLVERFDYAITAAMFCGVGLLFTAGDRAALARPSVDDERGGQQSLARKLVRALHCHSERSEESRPALDSSLRSE